MIDSVIPVQLDEGAYMPERAHELDAGLDLRSPVDVLVPCSGGSAIIDTGVHVQLPPDSVGMLKSKSGLNVKHGIVSEGVIDCGYDGSITVKLYNHSDTAYQVKRGDKISQLVILPVLRPTPVQVDKIEGGERGDNGFGSTGREGGSMTRASILKRAIECVCGEREQDYGSPEDNFNRIAKYWSTHLGMEITAEDVAVMMALLKIARIGTGTATDDSWIDLAGYAACGGEIAAKGRKRG